MPESIQARETKENWLIKLPLIILSSISALACAVIVFYLIEEYVGYSGNKMGVFAIAGLFVGYYITHLLWMLYRKFYPKAPKPG